MKNKCIYDVAGVVVAAAGVVSEVEDGDGHLHASDDAADPGNDTGGEA